MKEKPPKKEGKYTALRNFTDAQDKLVRAIYDCKNESGK
jgi:hypothetical protein